MKRILILVCLSVAYPAFADQLGQSYCNRSDQRHCQRTFNGDLEICKHALGDNGDACREKALQDNEQCLRSAGCLARE